MTAIYESLLLKLVTVLELTQQSESTPTTQTRQALVQAVRVPSATTAEPKLTINAAQTTDFRESLKQAKELASTLPGGELSVDEQEDVIEMLFRLRDRKQSVATQLFGAFKGWLTPITTQIGNSWRNLLPMFNPCLRPLLPKAS